jgi:hypothetical protein
MAFADGVGTADLSGIADTLIDGMPEPQEHAINAAGGTDDAAANASTDIELDALGVPYDPQKHSGNKAKRADGSWKRRRGTGSTIGRSAESAPAVDQEAETRVRSEAAARMSGVACANMMITLGIGLGGEEWMPRKTPIDEKPMLEQAFGDYFFHKGIVDIPPGVALCFAISIYALPRFAMPVTRTRFQKAKGWIAAKYVNWRNRKALKKQGLRITPEDGDQSIRREAKAA